ncbi:MAG: NepR family anti-sigma factor [Alterinioella nitratireducens]|jgi:predicted AAA+ superfamily ATPase|uniref:NepR family anti-sigma factor n=1 Tax=Alterinioella nitratireducens TaxID=2735915 RepID=UPI004058FF85|tara:strand:- start:1897 stop:2079 length:183 start_codon:yes stop_codon:yes gene_type:complete
MVVVELMTNKEPNARTRQQIDENLRRVFQEKVQEELPDRFKDLLSQLKEQDGKKGSGGRK